jgi:hypothetical protein
MGINDSSGAEPEVAGIEKKRYEKPGFRYEEVFVTSALSCSKAGDQGQCMLNPPTKVS